MMKLALIGCGKWGKNYLKTVNAIDGCELKWACDLDYEKLNQAAAVYPQTRFTENKADILNDSEVQGVIIATTPESHYMLAKEAISKGKAVLVEKPVTINRKDSHDLIELATAQNTVLMAGHTLIYHPAVKRIKGLLEEKHIIDDLCYLNMSRTSSTSQAPNVDVLYDLAVHDIYLSRHLIGMDPIWVIAHGERYIQSTYNNVINILLGFPNGKIASIFASFIHRSKTRKITLVASKTKLVFDDTQTADRKIKIFNKVEQEHFLAMEDNSEPLTLECIHFMECIREHKEPLSGKENIEFVAKIIDCISKSLAKGGEKINIF
ncbi:gfo/Idh/MocA family oxidoreductase [Clostridium chromiireducens]|uniref:Gfo/Idh/MocA family oxidoreductase n=1 Tax=Clostridium chromiireducens TaxID=225345 RepID=A0A399IV96_9CLOT|nr:Gfo/Idh/MocA family oxidoreductase [Clostridium chromiireducens]RII35432.1 gfo/Idh/MocA family oxidoreductase [Clostridium chromiireducens]